MTIMGATLHAFDFLEQTASASSVCVVFGDEGFLKTLVLIRIRKSVLTDDDVPFAEFDGASVEWRDVMDEVRTVSLFNAAGDRLVVIRDADSFVAQHRQQLEEYVCSPEQHGVLVLEVGRWQANTKLFKLVGRHGTQIDCRAPQTTSGGKQKTIDFDRVHKWLIQWARTRHNVGLAKTAAARLVDLIGCDFGMLDQDVAKLALYVDPGAEIKEELVAEIVGGWRAKTAWELIDAAVAGDAAEALRQLDRLLQSGEPPMALFGSISWSLRRFAAATRAFERAERRGRRISLRDALIQAGFNQWRQADLARSEKLLKRLGRERAAQLFDTLLKIDLALKGTHSSPQMGRLALEQLVLSLDRRAMAKPR
jgi:DNA polymerase-3 subunit delta